MRCSWVILIYMVIYRLQIESYSTQSLCLYYRTMSVALIVQIAVVIRLGNNMTAWQHSHKKS